MPRRILYHGGPRPKGRAAALLQETRAEGVNHNGWRGEVEPCSLVYTCRDDIAEAYAAKGVAVERYNQWSPSAEPNVLDDPSPVVRLRADGIQYVGGGWYEVWKGGERLDKVRGRRNADALWNTVKKNGRG